MLAIAGVVFAADQLTKAWALARLQPGRSITVVAGLVDLTLVFNTGVAFGFLARLPPEWRWVVTIFSLAALVLLVAVAWRIVPQGGQEGHGLPAAVRDLADQAAALRCPTAQRRHVGARPGLVDEDQAGRINAILVLDPLCSPAGDVRTVAFASHHAFF